MTQQDFQATVLSHIQTQERFNALVLKRFEQMESRFKRIDNKSQEISNQFNQMVNRLEEQLAHTEAKLINMICVSRQNTVVDMENMERRLEKKFTTAMESMQQRLLEAMNGNSNA